MIKVVLFDLDGTLINSAIQLVDTLNLLRKQYKLEPLPFNKVRPYASDGAAGLVKYGFDMKKDDPLFEDRVSRYLQIYTTLFNQNVQCMKGIDALIEKLDFHQVTWGIVTNKSKIFAEPIVRTHPILNRSQCLVCGDGVTKPKPSPESLLKALNILNCDPNESIYLGDDRRDVIAANDAGMVSVIASYGYLDEGEDGKDWGAHYMIDEPLELLNYLND
ncbi:MAG: HAD family hydrolase [Candidatus Methylopumilus sp.]|nr:HAD family hydrolase [Candidatus Methylopumilus sp.]